MTPSASSNGLVKVCQTLGVTGWKESTNTDWQLHLCHGDPCNASISSTRHQLVHDQEGIMLTKSLRAHEFMNDTTLPKASACKTCSTDHCLYIFGLASRSRHQNHKRCELNWKLTCYLMLQLNLQHSICCVVLIIIYCFSL